MFFFLGGGRFVQCSWGRTRLGLILKREFFFLGGKS